MYAIRSYYVLNVASVAGQITVPGDMNYGPTKSYLIALSKALAATVKQDGVHVMALCPGFTHTDFHQSDRLSAMKAGSPNFLWYDADVVIREGLAALERGEEVFISGRLYRYVMPILRQRWSRAILKALGVNVITSYSIHYTKLYEATSPTMSTEIRFCTSGERRARKYQRSASARITSYNVCYTKLLRNRAAAS